MTSRIPYTKPSITELEVAYAQDAVATGWGEHCYDYLNRFEHDFATHIGARHAIATSSGTGALHLGLAALGVGPGDEVILADTNWIASAAPIVHLGATPVFVDILEDSWCIDPREVIEALTPRTKAIVATHLYGNACDMDELLAIGESRGIPVIEDAAEAIGTTYRGRSAGSMGAFGAFSFHGTKTMTTGEGGAFVTSDTELYQRVLNLSNHGRAQGESRQFWPATVGYKYKMSNIEAAIGCAQLERIATLTERKRWILSEYRRQLEHLPFVQLNPEPPHIVNGAWMPTAVFSPESGVTREALLEGFRAADIDARVFFWPLSSLPMFEPAATPSAHDVPTRAINLPSYHDMQEDEISRVVSILVQVAEESRRSRG